MGVRAFGESKNSDSNVARDSEPTRASGPSILDVGTVFVGDESAATITVDGDGDDTGYTDPSTITANSGGDGDAPFGRFANGKPRKRSPNGSRRNGDGGSGSRRASATEATRDLAQILQAIHWGIGKLLKTPEWALTDEEAEKYGKAVSRVTELYDIPMMDEKSRAWLNLGIVSMEISAPRIAAVILGKKKRQPQVVPMPGMQQQA